MVEVGTATKFDISKLGFSTDFPFKIKIHSEWSAITLIFVLPVYLGLVWNIKYYVMRTEVGLSTDMFFHSSEYCAAIHIRPNTTKKATNFLCSTAKRQWFRAAGKGARAHVWVRKWALLPPTHIPVLSCPSAGCSGERAERRWKMAQPFLHPKQHER